MIPYTCEYCGQDTSEVDIDYLVDFNHLSCALKAELKQREETNPIEKCVACGVDTQYHFQDHIDLRIGYVEGAGQLCTKCWNKDNTTIEEPLGLGTPFPDRRLLVVEVDMIKRTPNDQELGAKVRQLYYETYNNG